MELRNALLLLAFIAVCELAGAVGSVFTLPSIATWYAALNKPPFTPPNWLFGPVWVTLYLLMGVSLYLVYRGRKGRKAGLAIGAFSAQLALNVAWSIVFFGLHSILYGFVAIALLWLAIAVTIAASYRVSRASAYALLPYIAWVTVAAALNLSVLMLN